MPHYTVVEQWNNLFGRCDNEVALVCGFVAFNIALHLSDEGLGIFDILLDLSLEVADLLPDDLCLIRALWLLLTFLRLLCLFLGLFQNELVIFSQFLDENLLILLKDLRVRESSGTSKESEECNFIHL